MAQQTITLAPAESKVVSFEATPQEAKTYQVSVNSLAGSFVATEKPYSVGVFIYDEQVPAHVAGTLIIDGVTYSAYTYIKLTAGYHTVNLNIPTGYNFVRWDIYYAPTAKLLQTATARPLNVNIDRDSLGIWAIISRTTVPPPTAQVAALVVKGSIYENLNFSGWLNAVEADTGMKAGAYSVNIADLEETLLRSDTKVWMYVGSLGDLWAGFPYWLSKSPEDGSQMPRQPIGLPWEGMGDRTVPGTLAYGAIISYVIIPDYSDTTPQTDAQKLSRAQAALNAFADFHTTRQCTKRLVGRVGFTESVGSDILAKQTSFAQVLSGAIPGSSFDVQRLVSKTGFLSAYAGTKPLALMASGHASFNTVFCFTGLAEDPLIAKEVGQIYPRYFHVTGCFASYIWSWREGGKFVCTDNPPYYGSGWALLASDGRVISMIAESSSNPAWCFWDAAPYLAQGQTVGEAILSQAAADPRRIYGVLYGDPTFNFL